MNNDINWDDVEGATATLEGLEIKYKSGAVGQLVTTHANQAANMQRGVWCRKVTDKLTLFSQHLHDLLQVKSANPGAPGIDQAIATCKDHIAALQDLMRSTGCG